MYQQTMTTEDDLRESILRLERRVEALEQRLGGNISSEVERQALSLPEVRAESPRLHLFLIGRALIILGGAYLLRAITQAAVLPDLAGVALAFTYAACWIFAAHRASASPQRALFDGGTGVFIAFALAWESCARFHLVDAPVAAAMIGVVAIGTLIIAARDDVRLLAWLVAGGSSIALIALAIGTREVAPPALAVVAVYVTSVLAGARREWTYLAFGPGITLDLMLIVLAGLTAIGKAHDARIGAATIMLVAISATFAVFAWKRNNLATFDAAQLIAVLLIALSATTVLLLPFAVARIAAGVFIMTLAIAAYGLRTTAFTVAAVILGLFGSALAMDREVAAIVWAVAAIVLVTLHRRRGSPHLMHQAATFAGASVALSGLLLFAIGALFMPVRASLFAPGIAAIVVFIAIAVATLSASRAHLALIALTAMGALAMIVALAVPLIGAAPSRVATLRTILLAAAALIVGRFKVTRPLANPILLIGAVKLLAEDFRVGSPATLFVSLAVYGSALVLASRRSAASAQAPATETTS